MIVLIAIIWVATGILGWGWVNHCLYLMDPAGDKDPIKWLVFCLAPFIGPVMLLTNLIVNHGALSWGLRFK